MVGLVIKFKERTKNIIKEILNGIDLSDVYYTIYHWESFGDDIDGSDCDFNNIDNISSDVVKDKILLEDNYICPEFMELFLSKSAPLTKKIYAYKDFIESNCMLSFISIDYYHLEICCKSEEIAHNIHNRFLNLNLHESKVKLLKTYQITLYLDLGVAQMKKELKIRSLLLCEN